MGSTRWLAKGPILNLRDAAAYHALVLSAEGASLETQRNYLFHWRKLIDFCDASGAGIDLSLFTAELVRGASEWYRRHANAAASRQGAVGVRQFNQRMNTAGNFLIRETIIPEAQYRPVKAPRVAKVLRRPFTHVEISAMWGACQQSRNPERDEALFLLLLDTGMRIGEAAALTLDKLNMVTCQVVVGEHGKSKRERIVPLGSTERRDGGRTLRALRRYLAVRPGTAFDQSLLFLSHEGYPIRPVALSQAIQGLGKIAGVVQPIPHRLRHTFCTDYLTMYPGDEIGLRRIVGHLSHAVLEDYVHLSQSTVAERAGHVALSERWLGAGRNIPSLNGPSRIVQPRPTLKGVVGSARVGSNPASAPTRGRGEADHRAGQPSRGQRHSV